MVVAFCRIVDTELHAVLLKQLQDLNYEARHQQVVAIRERTKGMIEIENVRPTTKKRLCAWKSRPCLIMKHCAPISQARASVLRGGADAVGRYTVDLIKKQRSRSGMLETTS